MATPRLIILKVKRNTINTVSIMQPQTVPSPYNAEDRKKKVKNMKQITKKQALETMLNNKGVTAFINHKAFNALTTERLNRYIDSKRINLFKPMLYEFKAYRNGYKRVNIVNDDTSYMDSLKNYTAYLYENENAKMVILVSDVYDNVIVNTFFKGLSAA